MRPNSIVGWDLLGRTVLIYKTDTIRDFLFLLWTLWCVGVVFGVQWIILAWENPAWKWSQHTDEERNKRGAERTQSHSAWLLPKTSNLCVSSYVSKCCLAFWLLAAKWILTNTVAIIHKKLLETKRQGNQCRPGFWPHFCLAPLSQSI